MAFQIILNSPHKLNHYHNLDPIALINSIQVISCCNLAFENLRDQAHNEPIFITPAYSVATLNDASHLQTKHCQEYADLPSTLLDVVFRIEINVYTEIDR